MSNVHTRFNCADEEGFGQIRVDEALRQLLAAVDAVQGFEKVPLREAVGRVLHHPLVSPRNVPSHTNAAVDGYALRAEDIPPAGENAELTICGDSLAGRPHGGTVEKGRCVRITTGAALPVGADTVLMQEHVEVSGDTIRIDGRHSGGANVRLAGEDLAAGDCVLRSGRLCTPPDIGLIASMGIGDVDVIRRPRVAIVSTGDEIRTFGETLGYGDIYDSNRHTLSAALKRWAVDVLDLGVIPDDRESFARAFREAADSADMVITSGGASVGAADYTREVLEKLGTVRFWNVTLKPGRPLAFGHIGPATFLGLPGNPVAVMVTFYQFVLPALEKRMGVTDRPLVPTLMARSCERLRKKPGRTEFQRGILEPSTDGEWQVRTTGRQGSGILRSMSLANAFIILPHESGPVEAGERVQVQPFSGLM